MVIWKERQHDYDDSHAKENAGCISSLRGCGLLKHFHAPSMVSHVQLLKHILRMWNTEQHHFDVGPPILTIELEDIYFLTGLSRRGAPISLTGSEGRDISTQELIVRHCNPGTKMSGKKIPIKEVRDLPLRTMIFTM